MKLTREDKIKIYNERKLGWTLTALSSKYRIDENDLRYLIELIDYHGVDILRVGKNQKYTKDFKEYAIKCSLIYEESIFSIAIKLGLTSRGMLINWIRQYKENGYNVIEKKRGRVPMKKEQPTPKELTPEEELEIAKKQIEYLEAENEYLKKLRAVVQARKKREQKKK